MSSDCIDASLESFHFEEAIPVAAPPLMLLLNEEIRTEEEEEEEEDGIVEAGGGGGDVNPACISRCTEAQSSGGKPARIGEGTKVESRALEGGRRNVDPMCVNASNPYHRCTEHCSQRTPQARRVQKGERSMEEGRLVGGGRHVDLVCVNASNPYHRCTEYCSQRTPESRRQTKGGKSGPKLFLPHRCKAHVVVTKVHNLIGSKEEDRVVRGGRNVDPMCVNSSNPYHQCTMYCSQRTPEAKRQSEGGKSVENGKRSKEKSRVVGGGRNVDPMCINAANPYHMCTEYCSQRTPERRRKTKEGKSAKTMNGVKMGENRNVDPSCVNAEESRGATKVERRDVNPKCINSSNPYHKCTDHCLQRNHKAM